MIPPFGQEFSNLRYVSLGGNRFGGEIPPTIGDVENLDTLILSNNLLEGVIPASLENLTKLQYLSLERNQLSGELPDGLKNMEYLLWVNPANEPRRVIGRNRMISARLWWDPSPDSTVAGYHVHRAESEQAPFERVTDEMLRRPYFQDPDVEAGKQYYYAVTSVAYSGKESKFSSVVGVTTSSAIPDR